MAEAQFQLDEHLPTALARELRRQGIEAVTTPEVGLMGASDEVQLAHAHIAGRVVVTWDSDFKDLHDHAQPHSGIVYFPGGRRSIGEMLESLMLVHATYTAEEMVERLEWM